MKEIGALLILLGLVCIAVYYGYSVAGARQDRAFEAEYARWQDENLENPSLKYPRMRELPDDEIYILGVAEHGPTIFLAGCFLYAAGSLHLQSRRIYKSLNERLDEILSRLEPPADKRPSAPRLKNPLEKPTPGAPAMPTSVPSLASQAPVKVELPTKTAAISSMQQQQEARPTQPAKRLSPWWPASTGGSAALGVTLGAAFIASLAVTQEALGGIVSAAIYYFIIIGIRYVAIVLPSRK